MGSGWASSCLRYDKSSKIKVSRYLQMACNPLVYRRINLQPHKRWQSRVKCDCINFIQRLDPACGTAGFLVSAAEYIRNHYEDTMTSEQWEHFAGDAFTGFDTDRTMLRISAMNLMLHSISHPEIDYKDSVSKQNQISDKFTMCLANPPFKGTVDAESINDNLKAVTNTKKTELLFLALFLRMLRKGGQCACIVPDGVLFGSSKAHKAIRKELVENHQLRAVISSSSSCRSAISSVVEGYSTGTYSTFLYLLMDRS